MTSRESLTRLYQVGVDAADPYRAVREGFDASTLGARPWIIAVGKGSVPMARGALDAMASAQRIAAGGLVIAPQAAGESVAPLRLVVGDHPVPGAGSLASADALGEVVRLVRPGDDVVVLLSGGASALMATPVGGISREAMIALFDGLLRSGAPIAVMNAFRKRVMRWGGGRLASALRDARVQVLVASDVIGNDLPSIGSGPCAPDEQTAASLEGMAARLALWDFIPREVREYLRATREGRRPETPKATDPAFATLTSRIVLDNATALRAIAEGAAALGYREVQVAPVLLEGEARSTGEAVARAAMAARAHRRDSLGSSPVLLAWGGETTVRLGEGEHGLGGRSQELALAAARVLHQEEGDAGGITLLAAGTDGRDGPTDAAGAIVDAGTWGAIAAAGRDPERDLDRHDAYPALDAARALLRPGMTGTNVNDLVLVALGG